MSSARPIPALTDDALRERLAVALGWTDLEWVEVADGHGMLCGTPPNWPDRRFVPDWPGDIEAAMGLRRPLRERGLRLFLDTGLPPTVFIEDVPVKAGFRAARCAEDDTDAALARAIAEAVLEALEEAT